MSKQQQIKRKDSERVSLMELEDLSLTSRPTKKHIKMSLLRQPQMKKFFSQSTANRDIRPHYGQSLQLQNSVNGQKQTNNKNLKSNNIRESDYEQSISAKSQFSSKNKNLSKRQQQLQRLRITQIQIVDLQKNRLIQSSKVVVGTKIDPNYDFRDLAHTLLLIQINMWAFSLFLFAMYLLRYYTLGCLIFIMVKNYHLWRWILFVVATRFLYVVIVMKTSLKTAQTKTETILKTYWNSKEYDVHEIFQRTSIKKLIKSFFKAITPPQLAFCYIHTRNFRKKFEIYSVINYINCSIEALFYYPLFIAYCIVQDVDKTYLLNIFNPYLTIILACCGEVLILSISFFLLLVGLKKKYGTLLICFPKKEEEN